MDKKLLLLAAAAAIPATGIAKEKLPNIVLINLDDVGYGDFSCYGAYGYTTPNIDKMAAEGVTFTHFLACQPVSGASRAGLLTGCYPNRIGFAGAPGPGSRTGIHEEEMTIGEVLKQKNYATAVYGKWHLGCFEQFLPLQNGFDEYFGLPYSNDMWPFHPQQGTVYNFPDLPTYEGNEIIGYNLDQNRMTTDYTERAINFIRKHRKEPFFVYVAHNMAHVPLAVSDKFRGKSEQGLYGDVMMEIDWSVGQIIGALREMGLEKNTLVVLTTDNGPWLNYGNHAGSTAGLRQGKGVTFDGGNRVPCIMYWKGVIEPGRTCNALASNIDLLPTFAEIAGAPLPKRKIDGVSLTPLIKGEQGARPRDYFVYYYNQNDLEAVTDGMYKLVLPHRYRDYTAFPPGNDGQPGKLVTSEVKEPELYDLRRDPGERYNVISEFPEKLAELQAVAEAYRQELGDNIHKVKGSGRREPGRVQK